MGRVYITVLSAVLALATTALAQEVPYYEPRNIADAPFSTNQIVTDGTEIKQAGGCRGAMRGTPFFYTSDPDAAPWDGNADPGDLYVADDPCGLRTINLSGVWRQGMSEQLYVVSHNPRSGAFSVRYLYTSANEEPRKTWGVGLEKLQFQGRIHGDDIWLDVHGVFPPNNQRRCPEQANTIRQAASVKLNYVAAGRFIWIEIETPRLTINGDCSVEFLEKSRWGLSLLELIP